MNIGLVLSGGMAKGAYQIGALKALSHFIPLEEIQYVSCASVGVLNGYAFITQQLEKAQSMWEKICCEESRLFISHILRSSLLQQNIKDMFLENTALSAAFYCSLLDFGHKCITYKNLSVAEPDHVLSYLKASVALPFYNRAVHIGGIPYFDGAMVDNIPVFPLRQHKLDYMVCIYFDQTCYQFESACFDNKIIKITFPYEDTLRQSLVFQPDSIRHMIQSGFERAMDILEQIFCKGYTDTEYIYHSIERSNSRAERTVRITGDVLVTNLNKVLQKFSKRSII